MKKNALILSGGGARGAFQMGALQVLKEAGIRFDFVSGVSAGALNGGLAAMGEYDAMRRAWFEDAPGFTIAPGRKLRRILKKYYEFRKVLTPFKIGVVSMQDGQYHAVDARQVAGWKELVNALMASASVPGIFSPVPEIRLEGGSSIKLAMDGGLRNISPMREAIDWADTQTEKVNFWVLNTRTDELPNIYSRNRFILAGRALQVMLSEIQATDMVYACDFGQILGDVHMISPNAPLPSPWDFSYKSISQSALSGTRAAKAVLNA